jgi:hypothetical protein
VNEGRLSRRPSSFRSRFEPVVVHGKYAHARLNPALCVHSGTFIDAILRVVTGPAGATPEERREFELACVAALKRYFEREALFNGRRPTRLALRGDYPGTELVITFIEKSGEPGSEAYDLWHEDPPGNLNDPEEAEETAALIGMNVAGL